MNLVGQKMFHFYDYIMQDIIVYTIIKHNYLQSEKRKIQENLNGKSLIKSKRSKTLNEWKTIVI